MPITIEVTPELAAMLDAATEDEQPLMAKAVARILRLEWELARLRNAALAFEQDLSEDCDGPEREELRNLIRA